MFLTFYALNQRLFLNYSQVQGLTSSENDRETSKPLLMSSFITKQNRNETVVQNLTYKEHYANWSTQELQIFMKLKPYNYS